MIESRTWNGGEEDAGWQLFSGSFHSCLGEIKACERIAQA